MKKIDFKRNFYPVRVIVTICLLLCCALGVSAQGSRFEWVKNMGGSQFDQSLGTAVDNWGNSYVTGFYADTAFFNTGTGTIKLISAGYSNGFLAKYGPTGNCLWAKTFGGANNDQGNALAVDGKGSVYVGGSFSSPSFTPPGSGTALTNAGGSSGYGDAMLMKYDSAGNFRWAKTMSGSDGNEIVNGLAVDNNYNVLATGTFGSTIFALTGTAATFTSLGQGDMFIAKYDSSGNYRWAKATGGTDNDESHGIAVDDSNNVYTTGFFNATADFDPGINNAPITSLGVSDIYIAKYDSNGNYKWATSIETGGDDYGFGIAVDHHSNAYITGYYSGQAYFPPNLTTPLFTPVGSYDVLIAKYDAAGNNLWAKSIGSANTDQSYGLALDGGGNVYITGSFGGVADFDPGTGIDTLTNVGFYDAFVAKYDANGNYKWAKDIGGNLSQIGEGIAVNSGNIYVTGYFLSDTTDFNRGGTGGKLIPIGGADGFLLKYACGDTSSSFHTATACKAYTLNGIIYTTSGTYTQVFPNTSGCDSTVTLALTLNPMIKPAISVNGAQLGTTMPYATYQWLKNGAAIPGANGAVYTVTENASYQVVTGNGQGCTDTSIAYVVTNVGIGDFASVKNNIALYPNPASDMINILSPIEVNVTLYTVEGRLIRQITNAKKIPLETLAEGIYMLHIADKDGNLIKVVKVIKQK